jgi:hypothetical protein
LRWGQLEFDFNIDGWTLNDGFRDIFVSADGLRFAGTGLNPSGDREAWLVVVPEPTEFPWDWFSIGITFAQKNRHINLALACQRNHNHDAKITHIRQSPQVQLEVASRAAG